MILNREQFTIDMEKLIDYVYLPHIYHPVDKIQYNCFMNAVMKSFNKKNNNNVIIIDWNKLKDKLGKFNNEAVCDMIDRFKNTGKKFKNK
jgi:hypothetical protein